MTFDIFQVTQLDSLPKCICQDCWTKIDDFHKFLGTVRDAQEEYLKQIVKYEVENETEVTVQPNFVEVITNCEDFNESADECITKPEIFHDIDEPQTKAEPADALCDDAIITDNQQNDDEPSGKYFRNQGNFQHFRIVLTVSQFLQNPRVNQ